MIAGAEGPMIGNMDDFAQGYTPAVLGTRVLLVFLLLDGIIDDEVVCFLCSRRLCN